MPPPTALGSPDAWCGSRERSRTRSDIIVGLGTRTGLLWSSRMVSRWVQARLGPDPTAPPLGERRCWPQRPAWSAEGGDTGRP